MSLDGAVAATRSSSAPIIVVPMDRHRLGAVRDGNPDPDREWVLRLGLVLLTLEAPNFVAPVGTRHQTRAMFGHEAAP